MSSTPLPPLTTYQLDFIDHFLSRQDAQTLLVAAPGTGKTMTAVVAAQRMLEQQKVDALLVISNLIALRDQWRDVAKRFGLDLNDTLERLLDGRGASVTLQALLAKNAGARIEVAARAKRWLIVADDPMPETGSLASVVDRMLGLNDGSKALIISRQVPREHTYESEFHFRTEVILGRSIIEAPSTEVRVARFTPSFSILRELQRSQAALDVLSWRAFEKLIATLLENDGYTVELTKGTKDGGVDIVAVKDLGPSGYFKAVWQAKKKDKVNKVGISIVRELADTRRQFGASKGVIVTSSYLTKGALERIDRDKYILGKVDRDDLDAWIRRALYSGKAN